LSLLEQIASLYQPEDVPAILVLTADMTLEVKRRALLLGANDLVTKPFDRPEVLLRVRNLLQSRWGYLQSQNRHHMLEARLRNQAQELNRAEAERQDMAAHLQRQVHYDAVTGLPNLGVLQERLRGAVLAAEQNDVAFALLVLDLDR
jgi:PleD family two-component response regulator